MNDVEGLINALEPVVADHGMEIVDLELVVDRGGPVLRLFVDQQSGAGVTVEDCARVSRDCGAELDVKDLMEGSYRLEVSSPGIERRLRKPKHFAEQVGKRVHAVLIEEVGGRKRVTGTLRNVRDDGVEIEALDGACIVVPFGAIRRANLKVF
jgi:ribosome maturation factor RimP